MMIIFISTFLVVVFGFVLGVSLSFLGAGGVTLAENSELSSPVLLKQLAMIKKKFPKQNRQQFRCRI